MSFRQEQIAFPCLLSSTSTCSLLSCRISRQQLLTTCEGPPLYIIGARVPAACASNLSCGGEMLGNVHDRDRPFVLPWIQHYMRIAWL